MNSFILQVFLFGIITSDNCHKIHLYSSLSVKWPLNPYFGTSRCRWEGEETIPLGRKTCCATARCDSVMPCIFTPQTTLRENAQPYRFWGLLGFPPRSGGTYIYNSGDGFDAFAHLGAILPRNILASGITTQYSKLCGVSKYIQGHDIHR